MTSEPRDERDCPVGGCRPVVAAVITLESFLGNLLSDDVNVEIVTQQI